MGLISKSHKCPYRDTPHSNLAYAVYTNGNWCYSCNKGKLSDRSYMKATIKQSINDGRLYPDNFTYDLNEFPTHILSWLYSYYVFKDIINEYQIAYVPPQENKEESLLFPIIVNSKIEAYQQRFFPSKKFYSYKTNQHIFECGGKVDYNTVVLVEDYISAIRVGEVANCVCLFGTNLSAVVGSYILNKYSHIIIWLDNDEPGQKAANRIMKILKTSFQNCQLYYAYKPTAFIKVTNLITAKDPKCYSKTEISKILEVKEDAQQSTL